MKQTALIVAALGLIFATAERAAGFGSGDRGTSGAQFLKISPSARPAGMGEAFAGVADDVNAVYYNPAGLGALKNVQATGSHSSLFQDMSYEFAAVSVPLLSWVDTRQAKNAYGVLGVSVSNLSVGKIERRSTVETDTPSDLFGSSDFAYAISYGYAMPDTNLSLGATAKFIDQQIDSAKSSAFALDVGSLYRVGRAGFALGARNVGTQQKYQAVSEPLPLVIFSGLGCRFSDNWLGSLELDLPRDNNVVAAFGTEYRRDFGDKLAGAARFGYNSKNTGASGFNGLAFGFGVGYGNFNFDFALVPFGDLGSAYKYSMIVKF